MNNCLSIDDDPFRVVDYKQGKRLIKKSVFIASTQIMSARFDPEDSMLAAVCGDGSLKIFHLHSGEFFNNCI